MNEKIFIRLFVISVLILIVFGLVGSRIAQHITDTSVETVLRRSQLGYGKVVLDSIRPHVLNGNNRQAVEALESIRFSRVVDEYEYISFVSEFQTRRVLSSDLNYYAVVLPIFFNDSSVQAGQVSLYFEKRNFLESRSEIMRSFRLAYILSFAFLVVIFAIGFVYLRRENKRLIVFIGRLFTEGYHSSMSRPSLLWSPITTAILELKKSLDDVNVQLSKSKVSEAIARTTQMLAHDVRKPFALFRMTLDRVKSAGNAAQMQQSLQEALPEVERSLASVNGLISDVLNVGGEFCLVLKPVRLAAVVDSVFEELKTLYPTRRIDVQVLVSQDLWLAADDTRLPRVFLNLFSNAIEAVDSQEVRLWVSATPDAHSPEQFEIRAGNSGSYIAAEDRLRLFDLFYTSGKKGGTGLGLAIVKKILAGHGTAVTCVSEKSTLHPQGKVEFVWTMRSSHACVESALAPSQPSATPVDAPLLQVAFIDDSPLVRWAWEKKLKSKVQIAVYAGPREFWGAVDDGSLQLHCLHTVITDHYFAPDEEQTGVEFAALLRERGFTGRILLASNGEFQPEKLRGIVDKVVDKQPVEWDELKV